ncbi:MAG: single-stranded DNA-binding protein [Proteobacteria bacterium]|nr:single-stranded DNA-binding protein [Pseudomonadota bacterium]
MLNKVILKGNIRQAPQVWIAQNGREIATFSLATSSSWKDMSGEWQTATEWHRVIVFRPSTVTWIKDVLKKGDTVYIEGKLAYQQWIDKYNRSRMTPQIVVSGRDGKIEYLRSTTSEHHEVLPKEEHESFGEDIPPCSDSENMAYFLTQPIHSQEEKI